MIRSFILVMIILVTHQVAKEQELPLVFVEEPMDVSVREGDDVLLHCKILGDSRGCQWTRGEEVINSGKGSMYQFTSNKGTGDCSLRINRTRRQDENLWSCRIQTPLGTFTSRTAQISFIVPPEPPIIRFMGEDLRSEQPITVLHSSVVHFECISRKGKPASTLEWILDRPRRNVQSFIQQSADEPHLQDSIIIWNVRVWFKPGEYLILCIAHHPGYNDTLTTRAKMIVQLPSTRQQRLLSLFIYHPTSITVREGDAVVLGCAIAGNASGCQWARGGHVTNFTQDAFYQFTNDRANKSCSLRISQTRRADETLWSCRIPTPTSQIISESAQISFIVPPDPPIIRFQDQDLLGEQTIEVNQSQPFFFKCISRKGKPASFLQWIVDMNQTTVQRFNQSYSNDPRFQDSIIIWNNLGRSESGKYPAQCISHHPGYRLPHIANVTLIVASFKFASDSGGPMNASEEQGLLTCIKEQNTCEGKDFSRAGNADYRGDFVTTIAISVPVTTFTIIGIVIGIYIKRRRSRTNLPETDVKTASFPTYLVVLPNVSKTELSNRPQFPLPRGSENLELQDNGSDCDDTYETIDDLTMPCGTNFCNHQPSPLTESVELHCYEVPSLERIADESQYIYS